MHGIVLLEKSIIALDGALPLIHPPPSDEQLRLVMYMIRLHTAFRLGFHLFFPNTPGKQE